MIEAGQLHLPHDASWLADFKQELLGFPSSRHDDQVDALSQLLIWVGIQRRSESTPIVGPIVRPIVRPIVFDLEDSESWNDDYDLDPLY